MWKLPADAPPGAAVSPAAELSAAGYRRMVHHADLVTFRVAVRQTDLLIAAERHLGEMALDLVLEARHQVEARVAADPGFATALVPLALDPAAPPVVGAMLEAAARAGVGPMAAVAGAIAGHVGAGLAGSSAEVIVENGGDVYCRSRRRREFMLLAEASDFVGLRVAIDGAGGAFGVGTSAGRLGHSLSFGRADAVMAVAPTAALADAMATGLANGVAGPDDVEACVERARAMGARGALAVAGDRMAAWGELELVG